MSESNSANEKKQNEQSDKQTEALASAHAGLGQFLSSLGELENETAEALKEEAAQALGGESSSNESSSGNGGQSTAEGEGEATE